MKTPKQTGRKSVTNTPKAGAISKRKSIGVTPSKLKQGLLLGNLGSPQAESISPKGNSISAKKKKKSTTSPEVKLGLQIEALLEKSKQKLIQPSTPKKGTPKTLKSSPVKNVQTPKNTSPVTPGIQKASGKKINTPSGKKINTPRGKKRPIFEVSTNENETTPKPQTGSPKAGISTPAKSGKKLNKGMKENNLDENKTPIERGIVCKPHKTPASVLKTPQLNRSIVGSARNKSNEKKTLLAKALINCEEKNLGTPSLTPVSLSDLRVLISTKSPKGTPSGKSKGSEKKKQKVDQTVTPLKKSQEDNLGAGVKLVSVKKAQNTTSPKAVAKVNGDVDGTKSKKKRRNRKRKQHKGTVENNTTVTRNETDSGENKVNDDSIGIKKQILRTSSEVIKYFSQIKVVDAAKAVLELAKRVVKEKKDLFDGVPQKISVQINAIKPVDTPTRFLRIPLPHPIIPSTADICLFVADFQGKRNEPDVAEEHYTKLLMEKKINNISEIIPLKKLKLDYSQHELKRKLACAHDAFLVEGKICNRILPVLGKHFFTKHKIPTPVTLEGNMKESIQKAISKCLIKVSKKGNSFTTQIGHTEMSERELADNIWKLVYGIEQMFPGKFKNIRSLFVKAEKTDLIPIYVSLLSPNKVARPVVKSIKAAGEPVKGELSTVPGATVVVYPSGDVRVRKRKQKDDSDDEVEKETNKNVQKKNKATEKNTNEEESEEEGESEDEEEELVFEDGSEDGGDKETDDDKENVNGAQSDEEEESDEEESDVEEEIDVDEESDEEPKIKGKKEKPVVNKKSKAKGNVEDDDSSSDEDIQAAEEEYLQMLEEDSPFKPAQKKSLKPQIPKEVGAKNSVKDTKQKRKRPRRGKGKLALGKAQLKQSA